MSRFLLCTDKISTIGCEESTEEDVLAIEEYEPTKKNKKVALEPLSTF
jgi:hypothetical protein